MKHLILGGARSGKSRYATQLALEHKELVALVCLFELKTGIYPTLLACPIPARAAAIVFMVISKPAKPNGLAATIANHISAPSVYSVKGLSVIMLLLFLPTVLVIAASAILALLIFIWRRSCNRKLNGFTGDTIGALIEVSEALLLLLMYYYWLLVQ